MQSIPDNSYGIIPIFAHGTEMLYLVVKNARVDGKDFWGFPKGHMEEGEDAVDAALRELKEEAGIDIGRSALLPKVLSEKYSFIRDGSTYDKTVCYRIGRVSSMEVSINASSIGENDREIADYAWLPFDQALERITFPESRGVLREAARIIENVQ